MEKSDRLITSIRFIGNNTKEIVYSNHNHKPLFDPNKFFKTPIPVPKKEKSEQIELDPEYEIFYEYRETDDEEYNPRYPNDYENMIIEISKKKKELKQIKKETLMDKIIKDEKSISKRKYSSEEKARKMLEKMGWRGQGLGKYEQGIITPLVAKRTNDKYGIIINANICKEERILNIISFYNRSPTNIILLTNISDSVTLDDEVISEIRDECIIFGNIINIKVFIFPSYDLPSGERIRIFIEYELIEESMQAFERLFDRYYAGKIITVRFYDDQLYYKDVLDSFNF